MAGLLIPRAGEVLRPLSSAAGVGIPASGAFASIILERLFDLITVLCLFALYLFVLPLPAAAVTPGPLMPLVRLGGARRRRAALAGLVGLLFSHRHAAAVAAFFDRIIGASRPGSAALSRVTRSFLEGLAVLKAPPRHVFTLLVQSLLVWIAIDLGVHWANLAMGVDLPFHSAFLIIAFLTVGVAVPTPGNVGGYHGTYLAGPDRGVHGCQACHRRRGGPGVAPVRERSGAAHGPLAPPRRRPDVVASRGERPRRKA